MLLDRVKSASKTKLQSGELKQATMYEHINANKPTAADVLLCVKPVVCCAIETTKLFKFALLIPPSTSRGRAWFLGDEFAHNTTANEFE